jgi:RNA polymerase primary sigma factor/RNA polymerase nonessential primary-like sigma factor
MGLYLAELRQVVRLSRDEEAKLVSALLRGREAGQQLAGATSPEERAYLQAAVAYGQSARERLIHAYLGVPMSLAKRYRHVGIDPLDLVQEGNLALVEAIDSYQPTPDVPLVYWVYRRIRQALHGQAVGRDGMHQTVHTVVACRRIRQLQVVLEEQFGRPPRVAELAAASGFSVALVQQLCTAAQSPCSLSQPLGPDTTRVLGDTVVAPARTDVPALTRVLLAEVQTALVSLTPRQQQVVLLVCGFPDQVPKTYQEVAVQMGCTDRSVHNWYRAAIDHLRRCLLDSEEYAALVPMSDASSDVIALYRHARERRAALTLRKVQYDALGRPARVQVLADADELVLVPDPHGAYRVLRGAYPRVVITSIARERGMQAGRYVARVVDGVLRIGRYLGAQPYRGLARSVLQPVAPEDAPVPLAERAVGGGA